MNTVLTHITLLVCFNPFSPAKNFGSDKLKTLIIALNNFSGERVNVNIMLKMD